MGRYIWEDITEMGLQEAGWNGMDWIDLAQHRKRWRALKPSSSIKCREFLD
jgi:hypothetical protein